MFSEEGAPSLTPEDTAHAVHAAVGFVPSLTNKLFFALFMKHPTTGDLSAVQGKPSHRQSGTAVGYTEAAFATSKQHNLAASPLLIVLSSRKPGSCARLEPVSTDACTSPPVSRLFFLYHKFFFFCMHRKETEPTVFEFVMCFLCVRYNLFVIMFVVCWVGLDSYLVPRMCICILLFGSVYCDRPHSGTLGHTYTCGGVGEIILYALRIFVVCGSAYSHYWSGLELLGMYFHASVSAVRGCIHLLR